ncbi:hypothetical protein [Mycolicibacter sinensis]
MSLWNADCPSNSTSMLSSVIGVRYHPLLGNLPAVAADGDARLTGQPGLQVGLGGLLIGLKLLAMR